MKKFKKIFAVLLTLAMVLGMSMTSFAAGSGSITVNGLAENAKVGIKQLITLATASDSTGIYKGWKFVDGVDEATIGMSLEDIVNAKDEREDNGINSDLSELELSSFDGIVTGTAGVKEATNGVVEFSGLEPGLYAIKAVDVNNVNVYSWMVQYVGTGADATKTVTAKGAPNTVHKTVVDANGSQSVASGDAVNYNITVNYPVFAEDFTNKDFTVTDTVEHGIINPLTQETTTMLNNLGLEADVNGNTLTISLKKENGAYQASEGGKPINIPYSVRVTDVSGSAPLKNTVETNVNGSASKAIVIIPAVDVTITKTNEDGSQGLAGAQFQLYKEVTQGTPGAENLVIGQDRTVPAVKVGDEVSVGDNGQASFTGLDAEETYYVKETVAPEGYAVEPYAKPLTTTGTITVVSEVPSVETVGDVKVHVLTTTYSAPAYDNVGFDNGLNFEDTTLASLPGTGGIGTTIFTIGGCAIMIIAAALFFASRRKSAK